MVLLHRGCVGTVHFEGSGSRARSTPSGKTRPSWIVFIDGQQAAGKFDEWDARPGVVQSIEALFNFREATETRSLLSQGSTW